MTFISSFILVNSLQYYIYYLWLVTTMIGLFSLDNNFVFAGNSFVKLGFGLIFVIDLKYSLYSEKTDEFND